VRKGQKEERQMGDTKRSVRVLDFRTRVKEQSMISENMNVPVTKAIFVSVIGVFDHPNMCQNLPIWQVCSRFPNFIMMKTSGFLRYREKKVGVSRSKAKKELVSMPKPYALIASTPSTFAPQYCSDAFAKFLRSMFSLLVLHR
jgi:hypothetical protein